MKFQSHGRHYETDRFGVIVQTDHRPFVYDAKYSSTYDTEAYRRGNETLQSLRIGFTIAAHGRPVNSILDVGFGNGAFMLYAKKHIPFVYGVDVTGVEVPGCYIMPEIVKADVVTFWDVLEHFPNIDFIRDLPCETIVLSLPYCHMLTEGKDWFDNEYKHRKPDEHIRHFNPLSLTLLMNSYGWKAVAQSHHEDIVRASTHGKENILSMAFKR